MNIHSWFPLGLTGLISLQTKGLSRIFSNTTVQKHQFFCTQLPLLWGHRRICYFTYLSIPYKWSYFGSLLKIKAFHFGYESWTVKKAESWRIDVFGLWCWRRLLRVPWTARRSNQSILKEISPGCSPSNNLILFIPFFSRLQSFPASESFPISQLFTSGGQSIGRSVQHQSFQWIFRVDFI